MRSITFMFAVAVFANACDASSDTYDLGDEPDDTADPEAIEAEQQAAPAQVITTSGCKNTFEFEKEFLIRDVKVVDDPMRTTGTGVWTFGHLIAELAGPRAPTDLAREWLETWETSPTIDGELVPGNAGKVDDLLIDPWRVDQFALAKAPFRLSAIVLRPDTPAGPEMRFVFSGMTPAPEHAPMAFNVAFEYAVTPAFEKRWYDTLAPLAVGSPAYNAALATLTEEGIHDAAKVNGSSLDQLRTNEVAIDTPWDLREFHLTATAGGTLARARMARQPRIEFDGSSRLASGVTPSMETYMARMPSVSFAWKVPGVSPSQRFDFAITTCAGCHSKETRTEFVQIKPRDAGKPADLSLFLLSRTCAANDAPCQRMESKDGFTDPLYKSHTFRTQDDRMAALNAVLAAANDCQP
jgi:cytochrome c553